MSTTALKIFFFLFCLYVPLFAAGFTEETVTYYTDSTTVLKATLYVPSQGDKLPVLMMIHEGGFNSGSRHCFVQYGEYFTGKGYAVMSIDYRLIQQGGVYPVPLQDCIEAIKWLKTNSAKYRVDKNKIILIGSSAGAYLATMVGVLPGLPEEIKKGHGQFHFLPDDVSVKAVISSFGVYDWAKSNWRDEKFMPRQLEQAASPIRHAKSAVCDFLLLAGERDRLFDPKEAQGFADALKKNGKNVEVYVKLKQDHEGICNIHGPLAQWELPVIENFLKKVLNTK